MFSLRASIGFGPSSRGDGDERPGADMDRRSASVMEQPARPGQSPYSSKIIKAGALLADTKTLLSHWDVAATGAENLDRIRRENVFGKASRSRVEDILAIFRQRYPDRSGRHEGAGRAREERFPAASSGPHPLFPRRPRPTGCSTMWSPRSSSRCRRQGVTDIDVDEVQTAR